MKLLFISLGCDKNLVDSEMMMGLLAKKGIQFTDDENEAEVIVINTCCFINDAKEESVNTILEMAELKKNGRLNTLIVTGCLAQRYRQEILDEIPEVDAVLGTAAFDKIVEILENVSKDEKKIHMEELTALPRVNHGRMVTTGGHYAYLKIAEGCDKCCTYCIIPKVRGRYRSVPMEELMEQAGELANQGVKELILVAQETTVYGRDLYGEKSLHRLIRELAKIEGIRWIRILYCYPEEIDDNLIEVIKTEPKVCHYLDIPIQHADDTILRRMGRRTDRQELIRIIAKLREKIPDIVLRTTLIAGFPGETEEQHETVMQFVNEMEFDRLGVFAYSPEEDTPAAEFPDQVDEEVKKKWRDEIMELQQEVAQDNAIKHIGRTMQVMIEGKAVDEDIYVARSYMDAPNVDGYVFVENAVGLMTGDMVTVTITGATEYDLIGE